MSFQVKIQEVNVEFVKNGKNGYEVANVNYLYKGDAKTTKIMSFSNPQVFKDVQKYVNKTVNVETTQNGKYTNWAKIELVDDSPNSGASASPGKPSSTPVRSTYETPEERAQRQLMIVRQSSIANSLEYLKNTSQAGDYGVNDTLQVAQQFVDFVYGTDDALQAPQKLEDMDSDIPH
jgi:hypothetical protein